MYSLMPHWCMPVLQTEARLRLGTKYLEATRKWYDEGRGPPICLDESVEKEALASHGYDVTSNDAVDAYREAHTVA